MSKFDYWQAVKGKSLGLTAPPRTSPNLGYSWATFTDALAAANQRWAGIEADLTGQYEAEVAPYVDTMNLGIDLVSRLDFSNPHAFLASVRSVAGLAGPVGVAIGKFLEAVEGIVEFLNAVAPAYALQLQDHHYAQLDHWIATRVMSISRGDDSDEAKKAALALFYGKGWVPIYSLNEQCYNSGADLGRWNGASGIARTIAENRHLFSMIAGPRVEPIRYCSDVSDAAFSAWLDTAEARASIPIGERLCDSLGAGGFTQQRWESHNAWAFQSEGLCFVNNLPHDIDPGIRVRNFYINAVVVNVTKLPNALLSPIADYVGFREKAEAAGIWNPENERRCMLAAFGTNGQAFKSWNLLRLIHGAMRKRDVIPVAALTEATKRTRLRIPGRSRILDPSMLSFEKTEGSGAGTAVAVVGGVSLLALLAWLALK